MLSVILVVTLSNFYNRIASSFLSVTATSCANTVRPLVPDRARRLWFTIEKTKILKMGKMQLMSAHFINGLYTCR